MKKMVPDEILVPVERMERGGNLGPAASEDSPDARRRLIARLALWGERRQFGACNAMWAEDRQEPSSPCHTWHGLLADANGVILSESITPLA